MRYCICFALLCLSASVFSQEFKHFNVGLGTGFVSLGDYQGGVLLYVEPTYHVTNTLAMGIRVEGVLGVNNDNFCGTGSYSFNGQYYFSNRQVRPFVGLGAGVFFTQLGVGIRGSSRGTVEPIGGIYPRMGFAYRHFVFTVDYNIVGTSKSEHKVYNYPDDVIIYTDYIRANYMSAKIGVLLGGGRKKIK